MEQSTGAEGPASKRVTAGVFLASREPIEVDVEVAPTTGSLMHVADQCVEYDRALIGRVSGGSTLEAHAGSWTVPHGRQARGRGVPSASASSTNGANRRALWVVWACPVPMVHGPTPVAAHGITGAGRRQRVNRWEDRARESGLFLGDGSSRWFHLLRRFGESVHGDIGEAHVFHEDSVGACADLGGSNVIRESEGHELERHVAGCKAGSSEETLSTTTTKRERDGQRRRNKDKTKEEHKKSKHG